MIGHPFACNINPVLTRKACGCRIVAIISAFQAEDGSSILLTRSEVGSIFYPKTMNTKFNMNPQIGIAVVFLVFVGAFVAYSHLNIEVPPENIDIQANISAPLEEEEETVVEIGPEENSSNPEIKIDSMGGLNEELQGFMDDFGLIDSQIESPDGGSTNQ